MLRAAALSKDRLRSECEVSCPGADNQIMVARQQIAAIPRVVWLALLFAVQPLLHAPPNLVAQSWAQSAPIFPSAEPFTLNSYDVIVAVFMIRNEPALLRVDDDGTRTIVPVRNVRSIWVDFNPDAFDNHQNRYDVELNGESLDWDHIFVEYDGEMVNLRLLFTYRNQQPVPDVHYRLE